MEKITITRISHQSELGANNLVQKLVRVDFRVGDDGPFNMSFREEAFDQQQAFTEISKFADNLTALREKAAGV